MKKLHTALIVALGLTSNVALAQAVGTSVSVTNSHHALR